MPPKVIATPYDDMVRQEAIRQGVDPTFAVAIMHQESGGNPRAVSPVGANGLMQLMPATAASVGTQNPFDPAQNVRGGVAYLKQGLDANNGNYAAAAAFYNAGPNRSHWNNAQTRNYIPSVESRYMQMSAGGDPSNIAKAAAKFYPQQKATPVADSVDTSGLQALFGSPSGSQPQKTPSQTPNVDTSGLESLFGPAPTATPKTPPAKTISGNADLTKTPSLLGDFAHGVADVAVPIQNAMTNAGAGLLNAAGMHGAANWLHRQMAQAKAAETGGPAMESGPGAHIARGVGEIVTAAPLLSGAGEVAGSALGALGSATGGTVGNLLTGASGLVTGDLGSGLTRIPALATSGALQGAGFNAMTGRNPLLGAEQGAIAGPILGGIGAGIKGVGGAIADALRSPTNNAVKQTYRALLADGFTPETAIAKMQDMGPAATLADVGQNSRRLADASTVAGGPAAQQGGEVMAQRAEERVGRLMEATQGATGQTGEVHGTIGALMAQRSADAAPLYAKLADAVPTEEQLGQLAPILNSPRGQAALKDGIKIMQDEALKNGTPFNPADFGLITNKDGSLSIAPGAPSFPLLQATKEGLDDMVEGSRDAVTGKLPNTKAMNALSGVRDKFRTMLTDAFPDYKSALDAWAGPSAAMDAVNMGRKALNNDAEVTAKVVSGLPDSQKEFYLQGVTRALLDKMASNPKATVSSIMRNRLLQQKIRAAFPSDGAFDGFMSKLKNEAEMMKTENIINKGSPTTPRQVDQANLAAGAHHALNVARDLYHGNVAGAIGNAARGIMSASGNVPASTEELGNLLFSQNPQEITNALIPKLTPRQQALRDAIKGANMLTSGIGKGIQRYGYQALTHR